MKRTTFMLIFIITNIAFIVLHIHKHTVLDKLSYQKQRLEKELSELHNTKDQLTTSWYEMKKPSAVKKYAQKKLGMRPISLTQIKKIDKA